MYSKYADILGHNELFEGIEEQELLKILNCIRPQINNYKKNEIIMLSGEKIKGIGIVLSGKIEIAKESVVGSKVILTKLSQGDIFSEVIAFSKVGASVATVRATENCEIMFIPPERITRSCANLCESHNILIENMLMLLAKRAMLLNKKIEYLLIKSMRGRLCAFLINIYNKSGKMTINLPYNRNELADYLGVSRPSMSRELGKMKEEGLIDFEGKKVMIKNLSKLKEYI